MENKSFSRVDTKIIKGLAILLMIAHHLFTFSDRIVNQMIPISIPLYDEVTLAEYIGQFGKICVSLFLFLGGFGIYKIFEKGKLDLFNKMKSLYVVYWKVFLIFIPIGFLFFENQPKYAIAEDIYARFSRFDFRDLIANFTGFSSSYNSEWWFFTAYLIAVLTFPLIACVIQKSNIWWSFVFIVIGEILLGNIIPVIGETVPNLNDNKLFTLFLKQTAATVCFWMGCVMAKYNFMDRFMEKMQRVCHLNVLTDIIWIAICVVLRNSVIGSECDIAIVPVFCVVTLDFIKRLRLEKCFQILGENSTNMWLIHSFFCYYFYPVAKIVYAPRYAVLVFFVEVIFAFAAAKIVDLFWKLIDKIRMGIHKRYKRVEGEQKK